MIDLLWQDFATTQVTAISAQGDEREAARLELKAITKKIRKLEKKNARRSSQGSGPDRCSAAAA